MSEQSESEMSSSCIKDSRSITRKLKTRKLPLTIRSIFENLNDVAGVRIICEYIFGTYAVRDALLSDGQIELVQEKDYIKNPKSNGYRSLHLSVSQVFIWNNFDYNKS